MEKLYNKLFNPLPPTSAQPRLYTDDLSTDDIISSRRLLVDFKDDISSDFNTKPQNYRRRNCFRAIVAHSFIFATYALGLLAASRLFGQQGPPSLTYTPAKEALRYEKVFYDGRIESENRFKGDPRPELDNAWHDLVKNNNIRLSKDELRKMNRTALELADGSGYFGQLNVYHHLHCLKFIREAFYADYYPEVQGPTTKMHVDHCIDDIRQALMCHADTSVTTFEWETGVRRPMPDFAGFHTCINWEILDGWATQRAFSMFDQKSLINPHYGIAFPLINGSIEYTPPGPDMHIVWPEDN